jgi:hypothetical protein
VACAAFFVSRVRAAAASAGIHAAMKVSPRARASASLLEAGWVAYRNRAGSIRDVGVARRPGDAGRVFAVDADRLEGGEL